MRRLLKAVMTLVAVAAIAIVSLRLLFPLPDITEARTGEGWPAMDATKLGQSIAPLAAAHPGMSGILPLERGTDAFAARVMLIRSATETIDAQYYIWQDDLTGIRLLAELQDAA